MGIGSLVSMFERAKKNRRQTRRFLEIRCACCFVYALASPAAERCENQKYAKKCDMRVNMTSM
jgi:hypothetical protein